MSVDGVENYYLTKSYRYMRYDRNRLHPNSGTERTIISWFSDVEGRIRLCGNKASRCCTLQEIIFEVGRICVADLKCESFLICEDRRRVWRDEQSWEGSQNDVKTEESPEQVEIQMYCLWLTFDCHLDE
jgi:hypothetical protein